MPEGKIHKRRPEHRERAPKHMEKSEKDRIDDLRDRFSDRLTEMKKKSPSRSLGDGVESTGDVPRVSRLLKDYIFHRALKSEWRKIEEAERLEQAAYRDIDDISWDKSSDDLSFTELVKRWDDLIDPFNMEDDIDYKALEKCGSEILAMLENIETKKEEANEKGGLALNKIDWVFQIAKRLATMVDSQLRQLSEGKPFPVANPAEALIDSCFETASLKEYRQVQDELHAKITNRDAELAKENNWLAELDENVEIIGQLGNVINGEPPDIELKEYLKDVKNDLDDKIDKMKEAEDKNGYDDLNKQYQLTPFSSVHKSLELFLKTADVRADLYKEFVKNKNKMEYRNNKLKSYLDDLDALKKEVNTKQAELEEFDQRLDEALNKLEAGHGSLKDFWSSGKKKYEFEIKRMERAATSKDQKENLRAFRKELLSLSDIGFEKAAKKWESLLQKPGVGGSDGYIDLGSMIVQGEEIRRLVDGTIIRISKLEKEGMSGIGGRSQNKLKELLKDFEMNCSAILRRIGSSLNYFYKAKRLLGEPLEGTAGVDK